MPGLDRRRPSEGDPLALRAPAQQPRDRPPPRAKRSGDRCPGIPGEEAAVGLRPRPPGRAGVERMSSSDLDLLIHRYFEGTLSPEEAESFGDRLRTDPAAA